MLIHPFLRSLIWLGLLVLLPACASHTPAGAPLVGTTWQLNAYQQTRPLGGTAITLSFDEDTLGGSAGCNQYGGGYQLEASRLSISDLAMTEMFCMEPAGVMEQEHIFLRLLQRIWPNRQPGYQRCASPPQAG